MKYLSYIFFFSLLSISCSTDTENGSSVQIVFNDNIDGVRIRDSYSTVISKLGSPNSTAIGDFPGVLLEYTTGPHAGVHVQIYTDPNPWGFGVTIVSASAPYNGKTVKGIGIGSARELVFTTEGEPTKRFDTFDWYIKDSLRTIVTFQDGKIKSFALAVLYSGI